MYKPALSVAVWLPVTPIKKSLSKLLLILTKFSQDHMPLPLTLLQCCLSGIQSNQYVLTLLENSVILQIQMLKSD